MGNRIPCWTRTAPSFNGVRRVCRALHVVRVSPDERSYLACNARLSAGSSRESPLPAESQDYLMALALGGAFEPIIPSVAWTAVCLGIEHPNLSAVDVLDRAVRAHPDDDLDFQFDTDEELSPPHPFAELLRRAFAPDLDPDELLVTFLHEASSDDPRARSRRARVRRHWNHVLLRFAQRYRLWELDPA